MKRWFPAPPVGVALMALISGSAPSVQAQASTTDICNTFGSFYYSTCNYSGYSWPYSGGSSSSYYNPWQSSYSPYSNPSYGYAGYGGPSSYSYSPYTPYAPTYSYWSPYGPAPY